MPDQIPGSRQPLLEIPPPREPSPPAVEVVYQGSGRTLTQILEGAGVRVPDELRARVGGLDITEEEANVAVRRHNEMEARARAVARVLGIVPVPPGESKKLKEILSALSGEFELLIGHKPLWVVS